MTWETAWPSSWEYCFTCWDGNIGVHLRAHWREINLALICVVMGSADKIPLRKQVSSGHTCRTLTWCVCVSVCVCFHEHYGIIGILQWLIISLWLCIHFLWTHVISRFFFFHSNCYNYTKNIILINLHRSSVHLLEQRRCNKWEKKEMNLR